jgi:hypothetical protein
MGGEGTMLCRGGGQGFGLSVRGARRCERLLGGCGWFGRGCVKRGGEMGAERVCVL